MKNDDNPNALVPFDGRRRIVLPNELPPHFFDGAKAIRKAKPEIKWPEAMREYAQTQDWHDYKLTSEYEKWKKQPACYVNRVKTYIKQQSQAGQDKIRWEDAQKALRLIKIAKKQIKQKIKKRAKQAEQKPVMPTTSQRPPKTVLSSKELPRVIMSDKKTTTSQRPPKTVLSSKELPRVIMSDKKPTAQEFFETTSKFSDNLTGFNIDLRISAQDRTDLAALLKDINCVYLMQIICSNNELYVTIASNQHSLYQRKKYYCKSIDFALLIEIDESYSKKYRQATLPEILENTQYPLEFRYGVSFGRKDFSITCGHLFKCCHVIDSPEEVAMSLIVPKEH